MYTNTGGMNAGRIQFPVPINIPVENYLSGQRYWLISADRLEHTDKRLAEISEICNELEIYNWLFRSSLSGSPYTCAKAAEWIAWSRDGWREYTHFSFAITDDTGAIAAACDIKSNDLAEAEVGYWSSSKHRGIMTNAVIGLCSLARQTGFQALFARTDPKNLRSKSVLTRAGFVHQALRSDAIHDFFRIVL